jgi:hypothetical protein
VRAGGGLIELHRTQIAHAQTGSGPRIDFPGGDSRKQQVAIDRDRVAVAIPVQRVERVSGSRGS